jgi:putative inorganic carbon (HCO3(-)) transporter
MWNNTYKIRMITAAAERYRIGLPLLILMAGITFGFFMVSFFMFLPNTIATFLTFAMMVPLAIVIVGDAKRFLLAILAICLPITVTITLSAIWSHLGGAAGYMVSVFDIFLGVLYLLWLIEIFRKKNTRVNFFPQISIPAFFLILMAALSMAFARFPYLSWVEIIEVLKMYMCFFYLANNLKSKSDVQVVLLFLLLGLLLEGLLGFAQHRYDEPFWPSALGGPRYIDQRVMGSWRSFNDFAFYLGFVLPVSLSLLFSEIRPVYRALCLLTFFIGSGSLMWTGSRGGWIGVGVGALFVGICVFSKIKGRTGLLKIFAWTVIVGIFVSPLYPRLLSKFYVRFGGDDRGSAASRLPQFGVAYAIIEDNALIGVGINNFTEVMLEYDKTEEGLESVYPVHNIFLHIAAEMGIFGIAAFMWLIYAIFSQGIRFIMDNKDLLGYGVIGMLGGILAFLVHGTVDTASIGGKLFMFIWFFVVVIFAIRNIKPADHAHL